MDFSSPTKELNGSSKINIETMNFLKIEYQSTESEKHTTPPYDSPDFKKYLGEIAILYELYSAKWFTRPVMPTFFLSRLMHTWNTDSHLPYRGNFKSINDSVTVYQEWCPEQLIVQLQNFTIVWKLQKVMYNTPKNTISGPIEIQSDQIPLTDSNDTALSLETTLRSRALQKVRYARLVASLSKSRADALTLRYYEKYGKFENTDSNSVLSSDSE
jgi:hypothetical protein